MSSCATLFEWGVAVVSFSRLRGDGELSALSSCPGLGVSPIQLFLFLLPQGTVSSLQDPSTWQSPR